MTAPGWPLAAWSGWFALVAAGAVLYALAARRGRWPWWRAAVFALGGALALFAAWGLNNPLASMTDYTVALMTLGQVASPFLLLGFPPAARLQWRSSGNRWWAAWLLDPWVAAAVFVLLTLGVNLPGVFDTALADALFSAPIGMLLLVSGLMFWAQLLPGSTGIGQRWVAGIYAWLASLPMMIIAAVWVWSGHVLYTPYLDVLCLWNLSPLDDQHYAGLVMFAAGLPLQLRAAWLLIMPGDDEDQQDRMKGRDSTTMGVASDR
ncbi:MAG: cytochrome c oxidase assembly protein [Thiomonas sp.]|uniref:Cytochrome c oxidase caa3 assembly factor (Caa3_CtaG) n=1 Tax=mine drainage metagenome TaxID=410659 RepID=E6PRT1_9ZZZZ